MTRAVYSTNKGATWTSCRSTRSARRAAWCSATPGPAVQRQRLGVHGVARSWAVRVRRLRAALAQRRRPRSREPASTPRRVFEPTQTSAPVPLDLHARAPRRRRTARTCSRASSRRRRRRTRRPPAGRIAATRTVSPASARACASSPSASTCSSRPASRRGCRSRRRGAGPRARRRRVPDRQLDQHGPGDRRACSARSSGSCAELPERDLDAHFALATTTTSRTPPTSGWSNLGSPKESGPAISEALKLLNTLRGEDEPLRGALYQLATGAGLDVEDAESDDDPLNHRTDSSGPHRRTRPADRLAARGRVAAHGVRASPTSRTRTARRASRRWNR